MNGIKGRLLDFAADLLARGQRNLLAQILPRKCPAYSANPKAVMAEFWLM